MKVLFILILERAAAEDAAEKAESARDYCRLQLRAPESDFKMRTPNRRT